MSSQLNRDSESLEPVKSASFTLFDRIFRDSSGQIVIMQPPNLLVLIAVSATVLQFVLPGGKLQAGIDLLAFGAWFAWAWQELFEGVNYFRRSLGLLALVSIFILKLYSSSF